MPWPGEACEECNESTLFETLDGSLFANVSMNVCRLPGGQTAARNENVKGCSHKHTSHCTCFFFGFEPQTLRQEMRDGVPDKNTEVEEQMLDGSLRKRKKRPCFVEAIHVQAGRTHAMARVVDQRHGPIVRLLNGNIVALPHQRRGLSSLDFITWVVLQRHRPRSSGRIHKKMPCAGLPGSFPACAVRMEAPSDLACRGARRWQKPSSSLRRSSRGQCVLRAAG